MYDNVRADEYLQEVGISRKILRYSINLRYEIAYIKDISFMFFKKLSNDRETRFRRK